MTVWSLGVTVGYPSTGAGESPPTRGLCGGAFGVSGGISPKQDRAGKVRTPEEDDLYEQIREQNRMCLEYDRERFQTHLRRINPDAKLETIDGGYRIKETATHYIDVMQMIFNWRVCTTPINFPWVYDRGWCYRGTGLAGFLPAALAALAWDGSDDTEPPGYFKRVVSE